MHQHPGRSFRDKPPIFTDDSTVGWKYAVLSANSPAIIIAATVPWCVGRAVTHGNNLELIEFLNYRTFPDRENGFTWVGSHFVAFGWLTKTPSRRSGRVGG